MKFKKVMICLLAASMTVPNSAALTLAEENEAFAEMSDMEFMEDMVEEDAAEDESVVEEAVTEEAADELSHTTGEELADLDELSIDDLIVDSEESADLALADAENNQSVYVLMNIPYNKFYGSEGIDGVDAVSSSTKNKPRTMGLAGGSYHTHSDGTDISGVIYPVKVNNLDELTGYKKLDDSSSVEITTTNRGKTDTATYIGKEALFESEDYSYYVLPAGEVPVYYKELTVTENGLSFGQVQGNVTTVEGVTAEVTYGARHAEIEMTLSGTAGIEQGKTNISGVILKTDDGQEHALKHVVNIWRQTELGWNTDEMDLGGKTITNIRYITKEGVIDYPVNISIKEEIGTVTATQDENKLYLDEVPVDATGVTATISYTEGTGRTAKTTVVAEKIAVENGVLNLPEDLEDKKEYDVTVYSDQYWFKAGSFVYEKLKESQPIYVLMNIPYDKFYGSEGIEGVDAVSSSTKNKPRTMGLAGGSYHKDATGTSIDGVIYPVKVDSRKILKDYTRINNASKVSVTVTNRGTTSTTTYTGKEALFESADYSYYVLPADEVPAYYKELTVTENGFSFGQVQGNSAAVEGVTAEITYGARHAEIEMTLSGTAGIEQGKTNISGVILTTNDGQQYALKHVVNIWRQIELGWNSAEMNLGGKTITNIRYITNSSIIDYPVSIPVKMQAAATAAQEKNTLLVTGIPADATGVKAKLSYTTGEGRNAQTTTVAEDITVENGVLNLPDSLEDGKQHNVQLSADQYWFKSAAFTYAKPQAETEKKPETEKKSETETKAEQKVETITPVMLRAKAKSTTKNAVKLSWNKVKNADGYLVYGSKADSKAQMSLLADVQKNSYTQKKLKKSTAYTYRIVAYRLIAGEKKEISKTYDIFCTTKGGNKTNYKKITLNAKKKTLKAGKTFKLKTVLKKEQAGKKIAKKVKVRYDSSNADIARVSANGKVTAMKKGTCYIYATSQEGIYTKCKVTVK